MPTGKKKWRATLDCLSSSSPSSILLHQSLIPMVYQFKATTIFTCQQGSFHSTWPCKKLRDDIQWFGDTSQSQSHPILYKDILAEKGPQKHCK
jgi:hypothetical protein